MRSEPEPLEPEPLALLFDAVTQLLEATAAMAWREPAGSFRDSDVRDAARKLDIVISKRLADGEKGGNHDNHHDRASARPLAH